jgi:hypothetical protein
MNSRTLLWSGFALFVAAALWLEWSPTLLAPTGPLPAGKYVVWAAFLGFTAYTIRCSRREDLFRSLREMLRLRWGRQVLLDLYLGLALFLFVVALHERSAIALLLWLPAGVAFVNLATLLYFALHYESIVTRLLG